MEELISRNIHIPVIGFGMNFCVKHLSVAIMTLFMLVISPALSEENNDHMRIGHKDTSQLVGHYYYCIDYPSDCTVNEQKPSALEMTAHRWQELVDVNTAVNQQITYMSDQKAHGVKEVWSYPKTHGDSEDYVLEKRRILMAKGWPATNVLITAVKDSSCSIYAVLTVSTEAGDFILDSIDDRILLWHQTPYIYYKRQSAFHSGRWRLAEHGLDGDVKNCVPIS